MLKNTFKVALATLLATTSLFADDKVMQVAKKLLPSTEITKVMPTEISNMFAVLLENEEVIYIYPDKDLIFIGEIYNKDGVSLSEKHLKKIGAKSAAESLDVAPLFKVSTRMRDGNSEYGFIVFTDPDCPYCIELEKFLMQKDATVDNIYTPIDSIHPKAREKSIAIISEKLGISSDDAKKRLEEGEKIAQGLRLNGTPQTLVYQISDRKPVGAIAGANYKEFEVYLKTKEEKK